MKTFSTILAFAAIAIAAPATAATEHSVTISIGDLDLSAAQDREVLDQRVASAARRVCKGGWRNAEARKLARECEAEVRASVAPQLRTAYASDRAKRLALVVNDPAA